MKTTEFTKLNVSDAQNISNSLQNLLADFQIYYANLRGFHWNIKGSGFFTLHAKFEELYDDTASKVDEIAERILQLGETPVNNFSEYLKKSSVKEVSGVSDSNEAVKNILETLGHLIGSERKILSEASEAKDEVTVSLLTDYLTGQEKLVWMLTAYLA